MTARSGFKKIAFCFVIAAFVFATLFGASRAGMDKEMSGQMGGCPLMPGVAICNMSGVEHIAAWQSMFTALPPQNTSMLAALLLTVLFAVFFLRDFWNISELRLVSIRRQRLRDSTYINRNALQKAYSDGILNPKPF